MGKSVNKNCYDIWCFAWDIHCFSWHTLLRLKCACWLSRIHCIDWFSFSVYVLTAVPSAPPRSKCLSQTRSMDKVGGNPFQMGCQFQYHVLLFSCRGEPPMDILCLGFLFHHCLVIYRLHLQFFWFDGRSYHFFANDNISLCEEK